MRPSQLARFLASTISAQLPVLITGSPGIGKTSIVRQAAAEAENDLVISHPAVSDPTEPGGFPWAEKGAKVATFLPFGETARVLNSTRPTTWFWDDLGQASPAVQASFMPWLLARENRGMRLPDHVTILAATNRRTDRAGVTGILEPVKSRFGGGIVELEADLEDWATWALQQSHIPPELVAFLRFKAGEGMLNRFVASADLVNCPTPRTWEAAGRLLGLTLPPDVEAEALKGAVGDAAATELMAFLAMFRQLPSIDAILMDPDNAPIPSETSILYAVSTALASKASEKNLVRVGKYAQRLVDAQHGEFATLMLRDAVRRNPELQTTPAFVRLVSGELGKLIGGG